MKDIEELLECPCWIIDILPERVPENSPGQYFAVENYYLHEEMYPGIKQKHIDLVLKLNCYREIIIDDENNPDPGKTAEMMRNQYTVIRLEDALIVSQPDETWLSVFNPDEQLLEMIRKLAAAEGMFVWEGCN